MDSDELQCLVCLRDYDQRELKPRILPCLHVVCHSCLQMVLDMAVRGRNHHDDVIVLKCPICRTTQPLGENDVNSFPVNKKILQTISNRKTPSKHNDVEDVTESLSHVSMDTYRNDPEQTRPMELSTDEIWYGYRNQIELSNRRPVPRRNPDLQPVHNTWDDAGYNHGFIPGEYQADFARQEFDDRSYMDDVIKQLQTTSDRDKQSNHQAESKTKRKVNKNEDDVMTAIRRSCAEMYGVPDTTQSDEDLVTDSADEQSQRNLPYGDVSAIGNEGSPNDFSGDWGFPGATGGMVGQPHFGADRYQRPMRIHHYFGNRMDQRNRQRGAQRRGYNGRQQTGVWMGSRNRDSCEDDDEMIIKQLQKEANHSPIAAEVLEELVRVKSMKDVQRNGTNSYGATNSPLVFTDDDSEENDIVKLLRKQGDKNPAAAEIVREMELVGRLNDLGHLAPAEDQSLIDQALLEVDRHPEARVVVDDMLAVKTGTTNTKDDVLEELMRASRTTDEARKVLDDMLNTGTNAGGRNPAPKGKRKNVDDPNWLVEEVLKDSNVSPEDKNRFISEIAASASGRFENDDTISMLMQQSAENPLAAQILHDMLSGNQQ